jgi:hypothetical protein
MTHILGPDSLASTGTGLQDTVSHMSRKENLINPAYAETVKSGPCESTSDAAKAAERRSL